ncbi:MAG TPA: hypothetical protein VMF89_02250, partial [Polyangiales bacterium]|nr:hypothetical protein [Polyangiales bacterium]
MPATGLPDSGMSVSPVTSPDAGLMDAAPAPAPIIDAGNDAGRESDASPAQAADANVHDAGMGASDASAPADGNIGDASIVGDVPAAGSLAIASPPAPKGCIDRVGPADKLVFSSCGESVVFDVSVPATCTSKACGLIFDVHGWTMSGPIQEQNTGLAALGRQEGYIVVQPSAPDASWNAETHDRVVSDFLKLAVEVWRVEPRRVHFTGFSQGGGMTYRMRCALADTLASVAPVSMRGSACPAGTKALDTLYIMGKDDVFV